MNWFVANEINTDNAWHPFTFQFNRKKKLDLKRWIFFKWCQYPFPFHFLWILINTKHVHNPSQFGMFMELVFVYITWLYYLSPEVNCWTRVTSRNSLVVLPHKLRCGLRYATRHKLLNINMHFGDLEKTLQEPAIPVQGWGIFVQMVSILRTSTNRSEMRRRFSSSSWRSNKLINFDGMTWPCLCCMTIPRARNLEIFIWIKKNRLDDNSTATVCY